MAAIVSVPKHSLWIGGALVPAGKHVPLHSPYDGSIIAHAPFATPEQVESAIRAAQRGAVAMAQLANYERADLLLEIAANIKRDQSEFAYLISSETAKPLRNAMLEVERGLETLKAAAHEARALAGEVIPMDFSNAGKGRMGMTVRQPLGVISAITPFNFPLNLSLHKIAPALAGGNAVVHKPSERTPLTALRLAVAIHDAGAPSGSYNVVCGDSAAIADQFLASPDVKMLTFTGSRKVGLSLRAKAGLKRTTLELGNNSAVIVEPDADMDLAVNRIVQGAFSFSGQVCISVQRAFLHRSIYDQASKSIVAATEKLIVGSPYDKNTDVSALIDEPAAVRVESWITEAVASGAQLLCGGKRNGSVVLPAVLANVPDSAKVACEEVFGPVLLLYPHDNLADAVTRTNATPYGLQAGLFTNNLPAAFGAARDLQVGGVMINDVPSFRADNMPYGGVKESGTGREGPHYAIEEMTELKLITWRV